MAREDRGGAGGVPLSLAAAGGLLLLAAQVARQPPPLRWVVPTGRG